MVHVCFICQEYETDIGHKTSTCPYIQCQKCGQIGHIKTECPILVIKKEYCVNIEEVETKDTKKIQMNYEMDMLKALELQEENENQKKEILKMKTKTKKKRKKIKKLKRVIDDLKSQLKLSNNFQKSFEICKKSKILPQNQSTIKEDGEISVHSNSFQTSKKRRIDYKEYLQSPSNLEKEKENRIKEKSKKPETQIIKLKNTIDGMQVYSWRINKLK